jgi:CheY-like chemotaxis protein
VLARAGAEVTTAESAVQALQTLTASASTGLRHQMSEADGYALLKRVRALPPGYASHPRGALTAHSQVQDRLQSLRAGFQTHARRWCLEELIEVVASLVYR